MSLPNSLKLLVMLSIGVDAFFVTWIVDALLVVEAVEAGGGSPLGSVVVARRFAVHA